MRWLERFRSRSAVPEASKPTADATHVLEEEVPRYPPFMKGLPVVSPDKLLATQSELIARISQSVLVNKDLFDRFYISALRRFAAFAHLLPASQSHHHRGAGGLLRHSIEVALWTLQAGDKMLLNIGTTPAQRRNIEPRWQLCAFLAGLLHDVGKPVTDVVVSSNDRSQVWKPITNNLHDWAVSNRINSYFLDWRPGRARQHTSLSSLVAERIITTETLAWIEEGGTDLIVWLMEALNNNPSPTNPLHDLVLKGDQASVERDMKTMGVAMAGYELGIPVERHLTDIMRRFIKESLWMVNEPGARVWKIEGGVYLVWPAAGDEIARQIKEDAVPGFPRTSDGILDMLVERQLAFLREDDEASGRFWKIAPEILSVKIPKIALSCIRLRDDALLSSTGIADVPGVILSGTESAKQTSSTKAKSSQSQLFEETGTKVPTLETQSVANQEGAHSVEAAAEVASKASSNTPKAKPKQTVKYHVDQETGEITSMEIEPENGPTQSRELRKAEGVGEGKKEVSGIVALKVKSKPADTTEEAISSHVRSDGEGGAATEATLPAGAAGNVDPDVSVDERKAMGRSPKKSKGEKAVAAIEFTGGVGLMLAALAEDLKAGVKSWERDALVDDERMVHLRWPGACSGYGLIPKAILDEASEKQWIWVDPYNPMVRLQEAAFSGETCKSLRLNVDASGAFLLLAAKGDLFSRSTPRPDQQDPKATESSVAVEVQAQSPNVPSSGLKSPADSAPEQSEVLLEPRRTTKETWAQSDLLSGANDEHSKSASSGEAKVEEVPTVPPSEARAPKPQANQLDTPRPPANVSAAPKSPGRKDHQAELKSQVASSIKPNQAAKMAGAEAPAPSSETESVKASPSVGQIIEVVGQVKQLRSEDGWDVLSRHTCLSKLRENGIDLSHRELTNLVKQHSDRLMVKGAYVYYKSPA